MRRQIGSDSEQVLGLADQGAQGRARRCEFNALHRFCGGLWLLLRFAFCHVDLFGELGQQARFSFAQFFIGLVFTDCDVRLVAGLVVADSVHGVVQTVVEVGAGQEQRILLGCQEVTPLRWRHF